MFDSYIPVPEVRCPECAVALNGWQGKDGPCALFVWEQGVKHPVDQQADDINIDPAKRANFILPDRFKIYTSCDAHWVEAQCETIDGIWAKTEIALIKNLNR